MDNLVASINKDNIKSGELLAVYVKILRCIVVANHIHVYFEMIIIDRYEMIEIQCNTFSMIMQYLKYSSGCCI